MLLKVSAGIWERKAKLSVGQNTNILQQTKRLQEEIVNFFVKRVIAKAGIPPSISEEAVHRVLQKKADLKWSSEERNPDQKWLEIQT